MFRPTTDQYYEVEQVAVEASNIVTELCDILKEEGAGLSFNNLSLSCDADTGEFEIRTLENGYPVYNPVFTTDDLMAALRFLRNREQ